ncbi:MAG TPA: restriction endonuclease subunit S, partial [Rhodothermales bacterium]
MKDTGVPALGAVPEHWQVRRLASLGRLFKGNGGSKEDDCAEGVPCVRYGDLYTTHTFHITSSRGFIPHEKVSEYTPIRYGDVLFAASGETIDEIGKSAVNLIESAACCGGDVVVFRPQFEVNARFLGYATDCRPAAVQKARMGRGITVKHIYDSELRNLVVALPPLDEQAAIVRFLDHVGRRIRQYIRAKKQLIALLNEQRHSVIHRAVTRGLDASIRLKPSSVASFGELPAHWAALQLRRFVSFVTSGSRSWADYYSDDGEVFVQSGNLGRSMSLDFSYTQYVRPPQGAEGERTNVQTDDILICITGAL